MTSTGGETTAVSLVGEQCTLLGKVNTTICPATNILQSSLYKSLLLAGTETQEGPQLGTVLHQGFPQRNEHGREASGCATRCSPLQQHVDAGRDGQETVRYRQIRADDLMDQINDGSDPLAVLDYICAERKPTIPLRSRNSL